MVLEKTNLQERLTQSTKRIEELEELLVSRKSYEGSEDSLLKIAELEEAIARLETENLQLRSEGRVHSDEEKVAMVSRK